MKIATLYTKEKPNQHLLVNGEEVFACQTEVDLAREMERRGFPPWRCDYDIEEGGTSERFLVHWWLTRTGDPIHVRREGAPDRM